MTLSMASRDISNVIHSFSILPLVEVNQAKLARSFLRTGVVEVNEAKLAWSFLCNDMSYYQSWNGYLVLCPVHKIFLEADLIIQ